MSDYYKDQIQSAVYGSRLVLYKRSDTPNDIWWFRAKVDGHKGYIRRSTKHVNVELALIYATQKFEELRFKAQNQQSLSELNFEQYFQKFMEKTKRLRTDQRNRDITASFDRYIRPYMGKMLLANLTQSFVEGYWEWRLNYWKTDEGKARIKYNPKRGKNPNAKTQSTHNAKENPKYNTLRAESSIINMTLRAAAADGMMVRTIKLSPSTAMTPSQKRAQGWARRDTFTDAEYNILTRNLYAYANEQGRYKDQRTHSLHKIQRKMLWAYILFLSTFGLRVGEARQCRWKDLRWGRKNSEGEEILVVRVRAETTKINREREAVSHSSHIIGVLNEWRDLSEFTEDEDLIFYSAAKAKTEGCVEVDMSSNFKAFLKSVPYKNKPDGLLKGEKERARSLYSLRHFYATVRLKKGVDYMALSTVMGTSPTMLRNHYSHVVGSDIIDAVTVGSPATKKAKMKDAVQQITNLLNSGIWDEEKALEELKRLGSAN